MLANIIEKAETKAGSQRLLSQKFKIDYRRLCDYKAGRRIPDDSLIGELAAYVGLDPLETIVSCKLETDKEKATLWQEWLNKWRPHGDSNPGYRRERASAWKVFVKHILGIKNTPKTPPKPLYNPFIITKLELY